MTRNLRTRFRAWRRGRPFSGGLLLLLAGLELLGLPLTGVLSHGAIKLVIYIGIGGVFGILIGVLLIVAGIAIWASPAHRVFYGIAGIVLGIVSFPASNLGGFFLAMLLAIIGGAMAFAWVPAGPAREPAPEAVADAPEAQHRAPRPRTPRFPGLRRPGSRLPGTGVFRRRRRSGNFRAMMAAGLPAVLAAGAFAGDSTPGSGEVCVLGICVSLPGAPAPSPSASPSATPAPSATSSGSGSGTPAPAGQAPGSGQTGSGQTGSGPASANPASASAAGASPGGTSPSGTASTAAITHTTARAGLTAPDATSVLTASSVTLDSFHFDGDVTIPAARGGTVTMMKFSASAATINNATITVTQDGATTITRSPVLTFTGGMTLYATKLSGSLLGLPLTFTPSTASSILLNISNLLTGLVPITMTRVTTTQPITTAAALTTTTLTIS